MQQNTNKNDGQTTMEDLISLHEASEFCHISESQLRLLVGSGKIWGRKIGRNWVTTRRAVEDYVAVEHKTGPKKS